MTRVRGIYIWLGLTRVMVGQGLGLTRVMVREGLSRVRVLGAGLSKDLGFMPALGAGLR